MATPDEKTPVFDGALEHACTKCDAIYRTADAAERCAERHVRAAAKRAQAAALAKVPAPDREESLARFVVRVLAAVPELVTAFPDAVERVEALKQLWLEPRRNRARVFARTGVSQRGKP